MTSSDAEISLRLADTPPCPRCAGETLLQACFPHAWMNARGKEVRGLREAVLCPGCDRGEPAADELMALFLVDGQLDLHNAPTFAELAHAWAASKRLQTASIEAIAQEEELWRQGDL
ncbi:DUF6300 family protein [Streptomyces sp. NPDC088354]|uniref:DUF6300 family protein n=1 Tax=Streptomyces sp. NPDC088354 TaxID=3365856 RepID=UPI0038044CB6